MVLFFPASCLLEDFGAGLWLDVVFRRDLYALPGREIIECLKIFEDERRGTSVPFGLSLLVGGDIDRAELHDEGPDEGGVFETRGVARGGSGLGRTEVLVVAGRVQTAVVVHTPVRHLPALRLHPHDFAGPQRCLTLVLQQSMVEFYCGGRLHLLRRSRFIQSPVIRVTTLGRQVCHHYLLPMQPTATCRMRGLGWVAVKAETANFADRVAGDLIGDRMRHVPVQQRAVAVEGDTYRLLEGRPLLHQPLPSLSAFEVKPYLRAYLAGAGVVVYLSYGVHVPVGGRSVLPHHPAFDLLQLEGSCHPLLHQIEDPPYIINSSFLPLHALDCLPPLAFILCKIAVSPYFRQPRSIESYQSSIRLNRTQILPHFTKPEQGCSQHSHALFKTQVVDFTQSSIDILDKHRDDIRLSADEICGFVSNGPNLDEGGGGVAKLINVHLLIGGKLSDGINGDQFASVTVPPYFALQLFGLFEPVLAVVAIPDCELLRFSTLVTHSNFKLIETRASPNIYRKRRTIVRQKPDILRLGLGCQYVSRSVSQVMRRGNNELGEEVVLFVGSARLLAMNSSNATALANRTIVMNEQSFFTYDLGGAGGIKPNMSPEQLINYEYEYRILPSHKPRLLLGKHDSTLAQYLKALGVNVTGEISCVSIINTEENCMNALLFSEADAILFYEAFNRARMSQKYLAKLKSKNAESAVRLAYNFRVGNAIAEGLNGKMVIDPHDFSENEEEVPMVLELLENLRAQVNPPYKLSEFHLHFRIIDLPSVEYALSFLSTMPRRVEMMSLRECDLDSLTLSTLLFNQQYLILEQLTLLQQVNLSWNRLSDDCLTSLSGVLKHCPLHRVDLSHNLMKLGTEGMLMDFLRNITEVKMVLDLSANQISNCKLMLKLLSADNPLESLILSRNLFSKQQLSLLVKTYMKGDKQMLLCIDQLQLEEPQCFEYFKQARPITMSLPLVLSHCAKISPKKLPDGGQQKTEEGLERVMEQYEEAVWRDDYLMRRKCMQKLKEGVETDAVKEHMRKGDRERAIERAFTRVMNLQGEADDLDLLVKLIRRYRLEGQASSCAIYLKHLRDQLIQQHAPHSGAIYQACLGSLLRMPSLLPTPSLDYHSLLSTPFLEIQNILQSTSSTDLHSACAYILNPPAHYLDALLNPKLCPLKVCITSVPLLCSDYCQIDQPILLQVPNKLQFITNHSMAHFSFSKGFIEAGLHPTEYGEMMSCAVYPIEHHEEVAAFIGIVNNLVSYIYQSPASLQTTTLLASITQYLMGCSPEIREQLIEEYVLRLLCSFKKDKHESVSGGVWTAIFQYITAHIFIHPYLLDYIKAFLLKEETNHNIYLHSGKHKIHPRQFFEEDMAVAHNRIVNRGRFTVVIQDAARIECKYTLEVHQLDTVGEVHSRLIKDTQFRNAFELTEDTLRQCWLCRRQKKGEDSSLNKRRSLSNRGSESEAAGPPLRGSNGSALSPAQYVPLRDYKHMGEIEEEVYLLRFIYPLQYESEAYLGKLEERQLVSVYHQAKHALSLYPNSASRSKLFLAECLIAECYLLSDLRVRSKSRGKEAASSHHEAASSHHEAASSAYEARKAQIVKEVQAVLRVDERVVGECSKAFMESGQVGGRMRQAIIEYLHSADGIGVVLGELVLSNRWVQINKLCLEWTRVVDCFIEGGQIVFKYVKQAQKWIVLRISSANMVEESYSLIKSLMRLRVITPFLLLYRGQYEQYTLPLDSVFTDMHSYFALTQDRDQQENIGSSYAQLKEEAGQKKREGSEKDPNVRENEVEKKGKAEVEKKGKAEVEKEGKAEVEKKGKAEVEKEELGLEEVMRVEDSEVTNNRNTRASRRKSRKR